MDSLPVIENRSLLVRLWEKPITLALPIIALFLNPLFFRIIGGIIFRIGRNLAIRENLKIASKNRFKRSLE